MVRSVRAELRSAGRHVGLSSTRYGSLTLGRQYDMIFYFAEPLTAAGMIGSVVFTHPGDLDNTGNSVRVIGSLHEPYYRGILVRRRLLCGRCRR